MSPEETSKRKSRLETEIANFVRQVGRKRQKKGEPNDRRHDKKLERQTKRMKPEDFDELLNM